MTQAVVYLENFPCALDKVYCSAFGWNVLKISMRSISSNVSFKTYVSLLIFCFDDLSIGVSGMLKSTIVLLLSTSPFMSFSSFSLYLGVCRFGPNIFTTVIASSWVNSFLLRNMFLCHFLQFSFKVYAILYKYCYPRFLFISICMNTLSPHFKDLCIFRFEVSI